MVTNEQLALKNQEIGKKLQNGESWFRIALSLQPDICQAARELSYSKIQFSLLQKLRMAVWFADFYERASGNDIYNCSWDKTQIADAKELWKFFFTDNRKISRDIFLSQCWALGYSKDGTAAREGKDSGEYSRIWNTLKDVFSQCLALDSNEWTIIENYDNPPEYFRLLMSQRDTATWRDFAEFIDDFRNCDTNPGKWHSKLFEACKEKLQDRAKFGVYLQWRKGLLASGVGIGVDHVKGRGQAWKIDATPQPRHEGFYPLDGLSTVSYYGKNQVVAPQVEGVYYRYISNPNDFRYHWWKRVDENTPIPPGRQELLICFQEQQHVAPQGEDGVSFENIDQFALPYKNASSFSGQSSCCALRINIANRPTKETILKIAEGWHVKLAGKVPHIEPVTANNLAETKTGLPVWTGDCGFRVSDLSEDREVQWECRIDGDVALHNLSYSGSTFICDFQKIATNSFLDVRLTAHIEGQPLSPYYFLWLPQNVMDALEGNDDLPKGWHHDTPNNDEELIQERLQGRSKHLLTDANGRKETLFLSTHATDFWFVKGLYNVDENSRWNHPMSFASKSEALEWTLIVPGNVASLSLEVVGKPLETPADSYQNYIGSPSVWRIKLENLLPPDSLDFTCEFNPRQEEIRCNGITVASFFNVPTEAVLCRNEHGHWGAYIPANDLGSYTAVLYTDNPENSHFAAPYCMTGLSTMGPQGHFHVLEDWISNVKEEDSEGELFLGLLPEGESTELANAIARGCPMCFIRTMPSRPYNLIQDAAERLQKAHLLVVRALRKNAQSVLTASRLARFHAPMSIGQGRELWKEYCQGDRAPLEDLQAELAEMLEAGYNFLLDPEWYFQAYDQLANGIKNSRGQQKSSPKMLQEIRGVLELLCPILIWQRELDACLDESQKRRNESELPPWKSEAWQEFGIECLVRHQEANRRYKVIKVREGAEIVLVSKEKIQNDRGKYVNNPAQRSLEWRKKPRGWSFLSKNGNPANQHRVEAFSMADTKAYLHILEAAWGETIPSAPLLTGEILAIDWDELTKAVDQEKEALPLGLASIAQGILNTVMERERNDSCLLLLSGLAIAVHNTVSRMAGSDAGTMPQGSRAYGLLLQVVSICFKHFQDTPLWLQLMRAIIAGMRLLGSLNIRQAKNS